MAGVTFLEALLAEGQSAKTLWLLGLAAVAVPLAKTLGHDKPRVRALTFFAVMHLVCLVVTAALVVMGSEHALSARVPGWAFGAVAFVGAVATLLFSVLLPRVRLVVPRILQDVLVALLSVIAAVSVASAAGANLSGLIATSAVFTAVLGFSLQDTIGNIAGGLALQVDNSIEVGDWIRLGTQATDLNGRVVDIGWRHTAIETRNWETVLVPNRQLMNTPVMVLGRRNGQPQLWRRWVWFNVDWRFQPSDVIDVVNSAIRGAKIQRVAAEPLPQCVLMELGESYGRYAVRYWLTDIAVDDPTDSEVRTRIFFALERAGMRLAMPAHAVFLTEESDRQAVKTAKQLARRRALLRAVGLFEALSDAEVDELGAALKYAPFTRGEVITKQGAEGHWLYLVEDGKASVRVSDGEVEKEVAAVGANEFFGEMSLLTGAPRSASVYAVTDVECFRLEKAAFQRVLEKRPELAQHLADVLNQRRASVLQAREGLDAEAAKLRAKSSDADLVDRIRAFFGLR